MEKTPKEIIKMVDIAQKLKEEGKLEAARWLIASLIYVEIKEENE